MSSIREVLATVSTVVIFACGLSLFFGHVPGAAAQKYLIGNEQYSGAWNITQVDCSTLPCGFNLGSGCYPGRPCPPVVIFAGSLAGTIDMSDCDVGVMYSFVNLSVDDAGIVVQHKGGIYGAKGVAQFGTGVCFCHTGSKLMCG